MTEYIFVLGKFSLCQKELEAVLKYFKITYNLHHSFSGIYHLKTKDKIDAPALMKYLGGTIKIAEVFDKIDNPTDLRQNITNRLKKDHEHSPKIVFGLSWYEKDNLFKTRPSIIRSGLNQKIKEELERDGFKVRYILPKNGELSSVAVAKQYVSEIIMVKEKDNLVLAKTLVVQDFSDWNSRDYGRPYVSPKLGMLPPKVARMMVNLGSGRWEAGSEKDLTLLDPFCGTGTILAEGLMLGLNVIGSDNNKEAIQNSQKNLEWLVSKYQLPSNFKLFVSDATHISEKLPSPSIDLIVTEPYLGPVTEHGTQNMEHGTLKNIIIGLEKLYIGCLSEWRKVLKPKGLVVIAWPSFMVNNQEFFVKNVVDKCEKLGYIIQTGPLSYFREKAVVRRNIYVLRKE